MWDQVVLLGFGEDFLTVIFMIDCKFTLCLLLLWKPRFHWETGSKLKLLCVFCTLCVRFTALSCDMPGNPWLWIISVEQLLRCCWCSTLWNLEVFIDQLMHLLPSLLFDRNHRRPRPFIIRSPFCWILELAYRCVATAFWSRNTPVAFSFTAFSVQAFVLVALVLAMYLIFEHLAAYKKAFPTEWENGLQCSSDDGAVSIKLVLRPHGSRKNEPLRISIRTCYAQLAQNTISIFRVLAMADWLWLCALPFCMC